MLRDVRKFVGQITETTLWDPYDLAQEILGFIDHPGQAAWRLPLL
jgi:hypothetical protein